MGCTRSRGSRGLQYLASSPRPGEPRRYLPMGVYYYYVNHSKRELFPVDCFGGPVKRNGIGRGLGARAFALMLVEQYGRWVNDEVVVLGDDNRDDWLELRHEYTDITANATLTVADAGGIDEVLDCAESDDSVFMQLCHLITTGQTPEFNDPFVKRFGAGFAKKYQTLCKERTHWLPSDLATLDGR